MKSKSGERRIVFLLVVLCLLPPVVMGVRLQPAPMKTAESTFSYMNGLKREDEKVVFVAVDFGPGTAAENKPQTKLVIEHLMRKRIPFLVGTIYVLASPFLQELPREVAAQLEEEMPGEKWEYGRDWVNVGFMPNGLISVQSLAKSKDWWDYLKFDADGNSVSELPLMSSVKSIKDVSTLVQITGLQGVFSVWLQFFQTTSYTPAMVHGCTSITIPEAYIYFSSGQIRGFFEGIAGAAWYEHKLKELYPKRVIDSAQAVNTGTSFAQLLVFALVFVGNSMLLVRWVRSR